MKIPTGALIDVIDQLDERLHQMRYLHNNGPRPGDNVSEERKEVYARLNRDIDICDTNLIELEQILALVNEYNEAHKNG
jgi:hypothetical protein